MSNNSNAIYFFIGAQYGLPVLIICFAVFLVLFLFGLFLFLTTI